MIRYVKDSDGYERVMVGAWSVGRIKWLGSTFQFYGVDSAGQITRAQYPSKAAFEASLASTAAKGLPDGYYGEVAMEGRKAVCIRPDGSVAGADNGVWLSFQNAFGGLHAHDVGKRIFYRDGVFQMENNAQRDRRLGIGRIEQKKTA